MKVTITHSIDAQLIHELLTMYAYRITAESETPKKAEFRTYMRDQLEMFGYEHAGLGENGYCDYLNNIDQATTLTKKWYLKETEGESIEIYGGDTGSYTIEL